MLQLELQVSSLAAKLVGYDKSRITFFIEKKVRMMFSSIDSLRTRRIVESKGLENK